MKNINDFFESTSGSRQGIKYKTSTEAKVTEGYQAHLDSSPYNLQPVVRDIPNPLVPIKQKKLQIVFKDKGKKYKITGYESDGTPITSVWSAGKWRRITSDPSASASTKIMLRRFKEMHPPPTPLAQFMQAIEHVPAHGWDAYGMKPTPVSVSKRGGIHAEGRQRAFVTEKEVTDGAYYDAVTPTLPSGMVKARTSQYINDMMKKSRLRRPTVV